MVRCLLGEGLRSAPRLSDLRRVDADERYGVLATHGRRYLDGVTVYHPFHDDGGLRRFWVVSSCCAWLSLELSIRLIGVLARLVGLSAAGVLLDPLGWSWRGAGTCGPFVWPQRAGLFGLHAEVEGVGDAREHQQEHERG